MVLIADSGAIYGLYDARDRHHVSLRVALENERGPILVPTAILSEIDYLLRARLGVAAERDFLDDIAAGAYTLEPFTSEDLNRCRSLLAAYADLDLGLADSAVIATAERLRINRILTVDERAFRAVRTAGGASFVLLPADEH